VRRRWASKKWASSGVTVVARRFFIIHDPTSVDKMVAEMQAKWLEKVPFEDHERDKKHPDRIELPT
jgi:hypothetical protein